MLRCIGYLSVNDDDEFWQDEEADELVDNNPENRRAYPDAFRYGCYDGNAASKGCALGDHILPKKRESMMGGAGGRDDAKGS